MKSIEQIEGMIGLEIHVYLVTQEKLFCTCIASREKGLQPNTNICPICTGQPGAKPMLPNVSAVQQAVKIGLMLECDISENMPWQRKHYDWPDLPKGYQNTLSGKHASPVGMKGKFYGIRIRSMHLEEDPAAWNPQTGGVDYNRSGLPLVEIVTEPDFSTSESVITWLKKLLQHLSYLKVVDSNAGIKVDVNVNIPKKTERVEIKNLNSLENIEAAINYELERQAKEGGKERETRRFDEVKGKTMKMREKESGEDYRFMQDPDLPPIHLEKTMVSNLKKMLPETPEEKLTKLISKYKLDNYNAEILTRNIDLVEFFEDVSAKLDARFALPWITGPLLRLLNEHQTTLSDVNIKPEHFVGLLELIKKGDMTELQGKDTIKKFYPKSFSVDLTKSKLSDIKELEEFIKKVINYNSKAVEDYLKGENNALNFLMGEIMKATEKRADFKVARDVLLKVLSQKKV